MDILLLLVGLGLILGGANFLTDGSAAVAQRFRVPEFIIGLTIVAVGTSTPELVVSVLSALAGKGDVAIGNLVGSNIFNVFLILGICALIRPLPLTRQNIRRDLPVGVAASLVLCAVLLGPWWGVGVAFVASLLRNLLGLGSLMAFPGSMFGALLCGLVYHKTKNLLATVAGEVFGTSVLGGLCAYPVAIFLMGKSAGDIAFYAYIVPFLISTGVGAVIAGILVFSLQRSGVLRSMQSSLS